MTTLDKEKEIKNQRAKLFEKENRIYKYYLNSVEDAPEAVEFIKSLFKLEIIEADKTENQDLVQLFDIVGFDKFFELLTYFSSRSIKFPKVEKIKKLLIIAIAYYQTEILRLSPKEAGKILGEKLGIFNLKQKSIKSLVGKLQQDIDHLGEAAIKKAIKDGKLSEEDYSDYFSDSDDLESPVIFTDEELDNVEEEEEDEDE